MHPNALEHSPICTTPTHLSYIQPLHNFCLVSEPTGPQHHAHSSNLPSYIIHGTYAHWLRWCLRRPGINQVKLSHHTPLIHHSCIWHHIYAQIQHISLHIQWINTQINTSTVSHWLYSSLKRQTCTWKHFSTHQCALHPLTSHIYNHCLNCVSYGKVS